MKLIEKLGSNGTVNNIYQISNIKQYCCGATYAQLDTNDERDGLYICLRKANDSSKPVYTYELEI